MHTKKKRHVFAALATLVALTGLSFVAAPASAQQATGATTTKECPTAPVGDLYTIGDTVECTATFRNAGALPATITSMVEQAPYISEGNVGNGPFVDISCVLDGTTTVLDEGDTLAAGATCTAEFDVTIPNDVALCNTFYRDRAGFELSYPQFTPPLTAGAFATHTLAVVCPPSITVEKTADTLGKVTDPVTYTIEVCNTSLVTLTKISVNDSLIAGVNAAFGATLAAGTCELETFNRTVLAADPDPLVNTVTAIYGVGLQTTGPVTDTASTNLFQPSVAVTKSCVPDPITVGTASVCTIVVTNTSSADTPALINGTINDTLTGNLLDPTNTTVTASNCTAALTTPCTITTSRVVLASDVSPLANTVTVAYNPTGFPNVISASATDSSVIPPPPGGEGCTPGYWKQTQHFDSWVTYTQGQRFDVVFGVDATLGGFGNRPTLTNPTLIQALNAGGGGENALARHAVAALLNAASGDVDSDFTVAEVIALVQDAYDDSSGLSMAEVQALLAESNEDGCPLN